VLLFINILVVINSFSLRANIFVLALEIDYMLRYFIYVIIRTQLHHNIIMFICKTGHKYMALIAVIFLCGQVQTQIQSAIYLYDGLRWRTVMQRSY
jgi:hypothetical protein